MWAADADTGAESGEHASTPSLLRANWTRCAAPLLELRRSVLGVPGHNQTKEASLPNPVQSKIYAPACAHRALLVRPHDPARLRSL